VLTLMDDPNMGDLVQHSNTPKLGWNGWGQEHSKTCNISETVQDSVVIWLPGGKRKSSSSADRPS